MNKQLSYFQIKDFNELNERKVIIFGASNGGDLVVNLLLRNHIKKENIVCFCDNNFNLWGEEKWKKKIISPNELKEYCDNYKDVIIIVSTLVDRFCVEIKKQIYELNIKNMIIFNKEIIELENTLFNILNLKEGSEKLKVYKEVLLEKESAVMRHYFYSQIFENVNKNYQFLSLFTPPKTGSSTIAASLPFGYPTAREHATNWMKPEDKINYKKYVKKIIIGVREPIAENLSLVYELKSCSMLVRTGKKWLNPQLIFNYYIIDSILRSSERRNKNQYGLEEEIGYPMLIQSWFEDELEAGLNINIFDYPFDKKAGYKIIKVDEYEILLYRLESMNSLEEVFGEYLDIKDFKFVRDNEASSKWYNESYRDFLKNVTMPKEYIDISYDSKYMKHFYTEEEILKFREKWEKHVDPNWSIQGE